MWTVIFYWSGSGRLVWANGAWAKKAAFSAQTWLLAPCPSHFHILTSGLRQRGTRPRDWWFPLEHEPHVPQPDSRPPHTLVQPHGPPPPSCYQSPWDGFLQSIVLSVPCCCSNPRRICVSNSLKWRHLCAILKTLVRVLVCCFDQFSLTCGQGPQRSSKGKDPSRQTSASHKAACLWIPVPCRMKAHSKAMNAQTLIPSPSPSWRGRVVRSKGSR